MTPPLNIPKKNVYLVLFGNVVVLALLAKLQGDDLTQIVHHDGLLWEWVRIAGFSILSFLSLGVLEMIAKRRQNRKLTEFKPVVITVFIMSSWLYVQYFSRITHNTLHYKIRSEIVRKTTSTSGFTRGFASSDLTRDEYLEICFCSEWLPGLRDHASHIQFDYGFDDFIGDYGISIEYDLPKGEPVDTFSYWGFSRDASRSTVVEGNHQRVKFSRGIH